MPARVRLAAPADLAALKALDDFHNVTEALIAAGEIFVATGPDDQPLAYAYFNYTFFWKGWVAALLVHPQHRRSGLGSTLLQVLETQCRAPKIFISTSLCNTPMQACLGKNGYKLAGLIENLGPQAELIYFKPTPKQAVEIHKW